MLFELKQKKYLKKLHIVQLNQKTKNKKRVDKLEQIDQLTFYDEAAMLTSYCQLPQTLFVFLLKRERL